MTTSAARTRIMRSLLHVRRAGVANMSSHHFNLDHTFWSRGTNELVPRVMFSDGSLSSQRGLDARPNLWTAA